MVVPVAVARGADGPVDGDPAEGDPADGGAERGQGALQQPVVGLQFTVVQEDDLVEPRGQREQFAQRAGEVVRAALPVDDLAQRQAVACGVEEDRAAVGAQVQAHAEAA